LIRNIGSNSKEWESAANSVKMLSFLNTALLHPNVEVVTLKQFSLDDAGHVTQIVVVDPTMKASSSTGKNNPVSPTGVRTTIH
jgi:hypothetical protein